MSFLPGWIPAGAAHLQALSTLALVSRTFSTSATVAAPADIRPGDLLLFFNQADGIGSSNTTVPAGFTALVTNNDLNNQWNMSRKIAAGTEGGTNITGLAGSSQTHTCLMVFRGNVPVRFVSAAGDVSQEATTGNPSGQSVDTAGAVVPFLDVGMGYSDGDLTDTDMPGLAIGSDDRLCTGYTLHNTSGIPGGGYNVGDGGSVNYVCCFYISLS